MNIEKRERNITVDVLRGIAMLMVVLQHTMSGCVEGAEDSFLFQIVWTLQMPLFILISGYVTKYSKPINTLKDLWNQIVKKTIAFLLPWAIWSFVVRGIIFNQKHFLDMKYLFWHMDTGYWFLFSIWTITMIFTVASYFAYKSEQLGIFIKGAIYFFGMVLLAGIGYIYGMSFLCIKLTLYYMPFYFVGYLYTEIERLLSSKKWFEQAKEIVVVVCLAVWLLIIVRVNIYNLDESLVNIALRAFSSLTGCIAVAGLISSLPINRGGVLPISETTLWKYTRCITYC